MANARVPLNRSNLDWAANIAQISLSGIRIFRQASVAPANGAQATYTVQDADTRRLIAFHNSTTNLDVRVNQGAAATSSHFPMATGTYFAFEVEKDDTVSFWNASGGALTIFLIEVG